MLDVLPKSLLTAIGEIVIVIVEVVVIINALILATSFWIAYNMADNVIKVYKDYFLNPTQNL